MTGSVGVEPGDTFTVTLTETVEGVVIKEEDRDVRIRLMPTPDIPPGETRELAVVVTKCIYSSSGTLETVFVSNEDAVDEGDSRSSHENPSPTATDRSPPRESSGESSGRKRSTSSPSEKVADLHELATDLIGDEVLEVEGEEESTIGRAKDRAKRQGRDPAIDPRFSE